MKTKIAAFVITLFSVAGQVGIAQTMEMKGKMSASKVLSAVEIQDSVAGKPAMVTTVEVTIEPNEGSVPHRHPGSVYGYVLEGTYEFKVEGEPKRVLKQGETFYEPRMILHELSRNPSHESKTRIIAVIVHPRDATQLMIPEPPTKESE